MLLSRAPLVQAMEHYVVRALSIRGAHSTAEACDAFGHGVTISGTMGLHRVAVMRDAGARAKLDAGRLRGEHAAFPSLFCISLCPDVFRRLHVPSYLSCASFAVRQSPWACRHVDERTSPQASRN
jgi:hypothetical protein